MGYVIAMAGKGGTGKTTIACLILRIIKEKKAASILAVDADPNSNLAESLGLESKETIGQILDDISRNPGNVPSGMPKERFIEYRVQAAVSEGEGFDVLTMGRPEGAGCYCYVNNVLRNVMGKLIKDYDYVIIDNEAGLEHLSRRTTSKVDALVVVSDASKVSLKAAERIDALAKEIGIEVKKRLLIINRMTEEFDACRRKDSEMEYIGDVPLDNNIANASLNGNSLMELSGDTVSLQALRRMGDSIWQ